MTAEAVKPGDVKLGVLLWPQTESWPAFRDALVDLIAPYDAETIDRLPELRDLLAR